VPVIVGALCALLLPGCSVDGQAQSAPPAESLAPRLVSADSFPHGASRVPEPAVAAVIADVAGPSGTVDPSSCRAPGVEAAGAAANVGPDAGSEPGSTPGSGSSDGSRPSTGAMGTGNLTVLIAYAPSGLDAFDDYVSRCGRFATTTAGAGSQITLRALSAPAVGGGTDTRALARTVTTGGPGRAMTYAITTLIAQRDGVRVYVEHRRQGAGADAGQIGAEPEALLRRAAAAAWRDRG
jgi:hypothetical protein